MTFTLVLTNRILIQRLERLIDFQGNILYCCDTRNSDPRMDPFHVLPLEVLGLIAMNLDLPDYLRFRDSPTNLARVRLCISHVTFENYQETQRRRAGRTGQIVSFRISWTCLIIRLSQEQSHARSRGLGPMWSVAKICSLCRHHGACSSVVLPYSKIDSPAYTHRFAFRTLS